MTVIDVMRSCGVEVTNELSWAVGAHVRDIWQSLGNLAPDKLLTTKTCGGGSHCIAHYPETFRAQIEHVIRLYQAEKARQGDLFE